MEGESPRVAVVGAGVVGLTVARLVQQYLKNANVTVIADKFQQDTTSFVAAGFFRPGLSFKGPTKDVTQRWINNSWHYWNDLLKSSEGSRAGVMSVSAYIFSKTSEHITRNHMIEDLLPIYRPATQKELNMCGDGWKYGSYFVSLLVSCEKHLPWATQQFIEKGGKIVEKKIDSITSLSGSYDLVFNCAGLGAKFLCSDHDLVPLRGQVIKVRAPWLKSAYYGDYDTYIIPGFDGIATLGGVRQYDSYNLEVCRHDSAAILERCCELVPALKDAEVVAEKVGLRPHRVPVRVEAEVCGGQKVVHCYGHGGYGVTCAPGSAMHAVQLGLQLLQTNLKTKL